VTLLDTTRVNGSTIRDQPAVGPRGRELPGEAERATAAIAVSRLSRAFGSGKDRLLALDGVDLTVRHHEFVSLLGASGCGKSTLLNILAGLDRPSAGTADVDGRVGLMFQESALFPWLTVRKNVEIALRLRGVGRRERSSRADALLESVHLAGFGDRRPHELSGGMRQRAALARALAQGADVLLMDEPFGALDAITREILHGEVERQWTEHALTIVFVTHDVREAVRLGDRVVLLSSRPGRVVTEFDVALTRPRSLDSRDVNDLAREITAELHNEVRRHAAG
jgi:NitT/TauT family transport system ATP-binding protein